MKKTKAAFTLIELLVVVLIIGILAAVALPQYKLAVIKSRLATFKPLLVAIKNAEEIYYNTNGTYTASIHQLDVELPGACTGIGVFYCDKYFMFDIIGGTGTELDQQYIRAIYCPEQIGNWTECSTKGKQDFDYKIYFNHSSQPNKIRCTGTSNLGKAVCKVEKS